MVLPSRSSSGRFVRRGPPKTSATDENPNHPTNPSASRKAPKHSLRASRNTPSVSQDDHIDALQSKQKWSLFEPKPTRARTRSPRPPTTVDITQSGALQRTTNGVRAAIDLNPDQTPSPSNASTPGFEGSKRGLAVPTGKAQSQDKRTLRSQDGGSRLKSDLAIYFPNYDEVINDAPKEPEYLGVDEPIYITDEPVQEASAPPATPAPASNTSKPRAAILHAPSPTSKNGGSSSGTVAHSPLLGVNRAETIELSSFDRRPRSQINADPLSDAFFFKAHRRAERKEKQLRNIEKERAMHEKVQLERLLDDLLGHDWLRVMGITGVTDSEKKLYEPKRDYFVGEVRALVDKFRQWKEEEKRQKMEREEAQRAKEEEEAEDEGDAEATNGSQVSSDDLPTSSEIDGWAARRLQLEAGAPGGTRRLKPKTMPSAKTFPMPLPPPSESDKPFLSFYSKAHLRASALGKHRHGRSIMAFGLPIPDVVEKEFELPSEYVTPETLKANARKRRRLRREAKA